MNFSIWFETSKWERFIVHIKGSQIIISKLKCTSVPEDYFYFVKQSNLLMKCCMRSNFSCVLSSADFLTKFFQEYHQCQTVWIQIKPNILSRGEAFGKGNYPYQDM